MKKIMNIAVIIMALVMISCNINGRVERRVAERLQFIEDSIASISVSEKELEIERNKKSIDDIAGEHIRYMPVTIDTATYIQLMHIAEYVYAINMEHPDIFMAQVILETNWLSEYKGENNVTGMRITSEGNKTVNVNDGTFINYDTIEQSIHDYKKWQSVYATRQFELGYYDILWGAYGVPLGYLTKLQELNGAANTIIDSMLKVKYELSYVRTLE